MTESLQLTCEELELIRNLAYQKFVERGCENGHDLEDWLQAEHEVRGSECSLQSETGDETCSTAGTSSEMAVGI